MAEEVKTVVSGIESTAAEFGKGLSQTLGNLFEMAMKDATKKEETHAQKLVSVQESLRVAQGELKQTQKQLANSNADLAAHKDLMVKQAASFETQLKECACAKDALQKQVQDLENQVKEIRGILANIAEAFKVLLPKKA